MKKSPGSPNGSKRAKPPTTQQPASSKLRNDATTASDAPAQSFVVHSPKKQGAEAFDPASYRSVLKKRASSDKKSTASSDPDPMVLAASDSKSIDPTPSAAPDDTMASILENILNHDSENPSPESMLSSLTLAAQIGQQLLTKTHNLTTQLHEEQQSKIFLQSQIDDLKKLVKAEHTLRIEAGLEVLRKDETIMSLTRKDVLNGDIKSEAENLRTRIDHLDSTHTQLDKILQMTNKELKTVVGERHILQLTVQELYDQLGNFMEINKSLKKSCQTQIAEYKNMVSDMQAEKKILSEQLTDEIEKIQNLSSKDSATIEALTKTIKAVMSQEQTAVFAHTQQQNVADMLALQSTLDSVESEKRELLELISRQQDTIKSLEEDVSALEIRATDKGSDEPRDLSMIAFKSLRSSLSNADVTFSTASAVAVAGKPTPGKTLPGFDDASHNMLSFLELRKSNNAMIEKEILNADDLLTKLTGKLTGLSNRSSESNTRPGSLNNSSYNIIRSASQGAGSNSSKGLESRYVSIETVPISSYLHAEEEAKKKLQRLSNANSTDTDIHKQRSSVVYNQVLKDDNSRLQAEVEAKEGALVQMRVEVDNLKDSLEQANTRIEEMKASSMDVVISGLESQVKDGLQYQSELSKNLVETKEELMKTMSRLAEKEIDLLKNTEEIVQIKLQLANMGMGSASQELSKSLRENSKLITGNVELGAQLSKLTKDFAQNLWDLREAASDRDRMKLKVADLEMQNREFKQKEVDKSNAIDHRNWGTQTSEGHSDSVENGPSDSEQLQALRLENLAHQKMIEILKVDLEGAKQDSVENSANSQNLRSKLYGIEKRNKEINQSVDEFLNGASDQVANESTTAIKVALFEARRMNSELSEKLKASEKRAAGQKETIFDIGSQLAQQSMKLGDIEWKLKQKEQEKEAVSKRVTALETEKDSIVKKLEDATREMGAMNAASQDSCIPVPVAEDTSMSASKVAYDGTVQHDAETVSSTVEILEAQKLRATSKIAEAVKKIESIDKDIHSLNRRSDKTEKTIAAAAKSLDERSKQMEMDAEVLADLAADNKLLSEEIKRSPNEQLESPSQNNATPTIRLDGASDAGDQECHNCPVLNEKLNKYILQLNIEISKTKAALQARFASEKEKSALSAQVIEFQKKLNAALEDNEVTKSQTDEKLKSYNEMKKLIKADREVNKKSPQMLDDGARSIPIIVETGDSGSMYRSGNVSNNLGTTNTLNSFGETSTAINKNSDAFSSTEVLSSHLGRNNNLQLELEASLRENQTLKDEVRQAQIKLQLTEDEIRDVRASEQRTSTLLASQIQERVSLSNRAAELQQEISNHIIAKSPLEAELLVLKAATEKKGLFRVSGTSGKGVKLFGGRKRASSAASPDDGAASPSDVNSTEHRVIEERDKLATELSSKTNEIAERAKEIADLTTQLSKAQQDLNYSEAKNASLARENEEVMKGMALSHAEVEECLQHQIQELADQLMEPKSYQELHMEQSITDQSKTLESKKQAAKEEASKLRKDEVALKEAQLQVDQLKLKIEEMEAAISHSTAEHTMEKFVASHLIDTAQAMLNSADLSQKEILEMRETLAKQNLEIEKLKLAPASKQWLMDEIPHELLRSRVISLEEKIKEMNLARSTTNEFSDNQKPTTVDPDQNQMKQLKKIKEQFTELKAKLRIDLVETEAIKLSSAERIMSLERDLQQAERAIRELTSRAEDVNLTSMEQISRKESERDEAVQLCESLAEKVQTLESQQELQSQLKAIRDKEVHNLQGQVGELQLQLEAKDTLLDQKHQI
ncbi:hypothetical protein HDU98_004906 [Podochytrium sp. JEL0797]|nr:hypothetical protein HDU98_004906 [Podochytrium sp. JEL0797]